MELLSATFHRCLFPGLAASILLLTPENSPAQILGEKSAILGGRPQVVAFVNQTAEKLVVHWIDFDGVGHEIGMMVPNQVGEITTFPGHLTTFSSGSRRVATFRASTISESAYAIAGPGGGAVTPGPTPAGGKVAVSDQDFGGQNHGRLQVTLSRGDQLTVNLDSNPTTGYGWRSVNTDDAVLKSAGKEHIWPMGAPPGAGGIDRWTFAALKPGVATLIFDYSQGWSGGQKGVKSRTITITVR